MHGRVLVAGGCGHIGSRTLVELIAAGYDSVSIDDNSRSNEHVVRGVEKVTGKRTKNYRIDLRSGPQTDACFSENRDAVAVIHFAACKSAAKPLPYYDNNITPPPDVLRCTDACGTPCFFSCSCAVYGNSKELPVPITEDVPFGAASLLMLEPNS